MKILSNGVAVMENDTHLSKWVEELNTIEIAMEMLLPFRRYIPRGSCVIDAGACIGDHTVTYANWVGTDGVVVAFEPLPNAFNCLEHNVKDLPQVMTVNAALSDVESYSSVCELDNLGASYLTDNEGEIITVLLDDFRLRNVSFIKMDIEGCEVKALRGAVKTILEWRPVMLIEVNRSALARYGSTAEELRYLIESSGYSTQITDDRIPWSDPQFDILCVPQ